MVRYCINFLAFFLFFFFFFLLIFNADPALVSNTKYVPVPGLFFGSLIFIFFVIISRISGIRPPWIYFFSKFFPTLYFRQQLAVTCCCDKARITEVSTIMLNLKNAAFLLLEILRQVQQWKFQFYARLQSVLCANYLSRVLQPCGSGSLFRIRIYIPRSTVLKKDISLPIKANRWEGERPDAITYLCFRKELIWHFLGVFFFIVGDPHRCNAVPDAASTHKTNG